VWKQVMQPGQPLVVGRQGREGCAPVLGDQAIGLFERGHFQNPLQQRDAQHFGIAKLGLRMGRAAPVSQRRTGFEELIDKTIDFSHLVLYAGPHRSSSSGKQNQRWYFDSIPPGRIDDLTLSTQSWGGVRKRRTFTAQFIWVPARKSAAL